MSKIQIFADQARQYRWRLRADNNEIVAVSEAYTTKQNAIYGAKLVQALAARALLQDLTVVPLLRRRS